MIEVTNLRKTYPDLANGEFVAVGGVSFKARAGQIFGLLGPNGAGKTTTLRILSTILKPTSGRATVNGFDVESHPEEVRHSIGFVSNNTAIYDRMTAYEMVEYFGRLCDLDREVLGERIESLFDKLKMNDIRDTTCAKMSTGMKQKVSIARALVHNPPVIVFDEASVGLDVIVARSLLNIVSDLRDEGKCIIFSTHIMREVERLCDRVAIMYRGTILANGTLDELRDHFQERDVEELFFKLLTAFDDGSLRPSRLDQVTESLLPEILPPASASSTTGSSTTGSSTTGSLSTTTVSTGASI